jgi:hypothetical protein
MTSSNLSLHLCSRARFREAYSSIAARAPRAVDCASPSRALAAAADALAAAANAEDDDRFASARASRLVLVVVVLSRVDDDEDDEDDEDGSSTSTSPRARRRMVSTTTTRLALERCASMCGVSPSPPSRARRARERGSTNRREETA